VQLGLESAIKAKHYITIDLPADCARRAHASASLSPCCGKLAFPAVKSRPIIIGETYRSAESLRDYYENAALIAKFQLHAPPLFLIADFPRVLFYYVVQINLSLLSVRKFIRVPRTTSGSSFSVRAESSVRSSMPRSLKFFRLSAAFSTSKVKVSLARGLLCQLLQVARALLALLPRAVTNHFSGLSSFSAGKSGKLREQRTICSLTEVTMVTISVLSFDCHRLYGAFRAVRDGSKMHLNALKFRADLERQARIVCRGLSRRQISSKRKITDT
jgi:hypothetical protein